MSDVNMFIDTIGRDVNGTVVPGVHDFVTALIQELAQRPELALDIPVALNTKVDELTVKVQPGTIKLDVVW